MALLNVVHMVIVGCGLTAVATGALAQQPNRPLRVIAANAVKDGLQQLAAQFQQQSRTTRRDRLEWDRGHRAPGRRGRTI